MKNWVKHENDLAVLSSFTPSISYDLIPFIVWCGFFFPPGKNFQLDFQVLWL